MGFLLCLVLSRVFSLTMIPKASGSRTGLGGLGTIRLKQNLGQNSGGTPENMGLCILLCTVLAPDCAGRALHLTISQGYHWWDGASGRDLYSRFSYRTFHVGTSSFLPYLTMLLGNLRDNSLEKALHHFEKCP